MAAIQTFKNLQDQVLAWLDEANDTGTTLTLVKNALNNANKMRSTQERWSWMKWDTPVVFNTVANQQLYTLHQEYFRPDYFWNRTQVDFVAQFDDNTRAASGADPNNDTGPANRFVLRGRTEVQNQPTSASVITVTSSNPGADANNTVTIKGDTANGVTTEKITAGTSGVVQFTKILKVTKNGTWTGNLTLTSNGGVVANLFLFPAEVGRSYVQIFFLSAPNQSEPIEYLFYRQPDALVDDNDRPNIPTPFEDLLVWDALLSFAAYNQYDPSFISMWKDKQAATLLALQQAEDARALEAATSYTSYTPR